MPTTAKPILLSEEEKNQLEAITRQGTVETRTYKRAKILLLKSEGRANQYIADKLDINMNTVCLCLKKFQEDGVAAALKDRLGRGRKSDISGDDITWVINMACKKPKELGYAAELWYPVLFTRHINQVAEQEGHPRMSTVAESTLRKILRNAKLKPFQITYYCEKRDPDFERKMHDVLVIYKQVELQFDSKGELIPFEKEGVHTLSYDEKPGIQAISTTAEDRAPLLNTQKSGTYQRDYEYKRLGTLSLLAAIDLRTGESIPLVSETHKSSDFVRFLTLLNQKYPKGDKIRLVLDNLSSHTSKETQEYLNKVPNRFEFVFTPTHGSWLNMVEGFFSKMTKQMLQGIRVNSKEELEKRIYLYFEEINKVPIPYKWTYKMDTIDLANEDIGSIVYEVINHKACLGADREKKAPIPKTRKKPTRK